MWRIISHLSCLWHPVGLWLQKQVPYKCRIQKGNKLALHQYYSHYHKSFNKTNFHFFCFKCISKTPSCSLLWILANSNIGYFYCVLFSSFFLFPLTGWPVDWGADCRWVFFFFGTQKSETWKTLSQAVNIENQEQLNFSILAFLFPPILTELKI